MIAKLVLMISSCKGLKKIESCIWRWKYWIDGFGTPSCSSGWRPCSMEWAGKTHFIRVMSNTPVVGQAASVISLGGTASEEDGVLIGSLFGAIGKTLRDNEKMFDVFTGLSGSGPAYIILAIEALADGGVAAGHPRDLAAGLTAQNVLGAAAMVVNTGKHPGQLKDDVASAGGTTIAAIHELEKGGFCGTLMNAVVTATNLRRELLLGRSVYTLEASDYLQGGDTQAGDFEDSTNAEENYLAN